jgi:hypothetical protein
MKTLEITSKTTDTQIEVHAAAEFFDGPQKPDHCRKLVAVCQHLLYQMTRGVAESRQAIRQADEVFDGLTPAKAKRVVDAYERMDSERSKFLQPSPLSDYEKAFFAMNPHARRD